MSNNAVVVGAPTQVEIGGKRFYRVNFQDGTFRHLRSVTSITKGARLPSFLDEWQNQQIEALGVKGFKDALDQKARDGTDLHKLIEEHTKGIEYDMGSLDADVRRMYENYLRWEQKQKGLSEIWTENVLYSLQYGYAGRADRKVLLEGRRVIIDYKSAKRAQDDHKEQGAAYLMADSEMGNECDAILILALGAETKQGYSETWLTSPYDIHQYFMGFHLKNQLINFHAPL